MGHGHRKTACALVVACWAISTRASAEPVTLTLETSLSTSGQSMWNSGTASSLTFSRMLLDGMGWGSSQAPLQFAAGASKSLGTIEAETVTVPNPAWAKWKARTDAAFTVLGKTYYPLGQPGPEPSKTLTFTTPEVDLGTVGLGVEGSTYGSFGLGFEAELTSGTVDVNLPVTAMFTFDAAEVRPGNTLTIHTAFELGEEAKMSTVSPEAKAGLFMDVDMEFDATTSVELGDLVDEDPPELVPSLDVDERVELVGFENGDLTLFGVPAGDVPELVIEEIAQQVADKLAELNIEANDDSVLRQLLGDAAVAGKAAFDAKKAIDELELKARKAELDGLAALTENSRLDKDIEALNNEIQRSNDEIAENQKKIDEINERLDDPNRDESQKEDDRALKDQLEERNQALEDRSQKLNEQINQKNTKKAEALNKAADAQKRKEDAEKDKVDKAIDYAEKKATADDKGRAVDAERKSKKKNVFDSLRKLKETLGKAADFLNILDVELDAPVVHTYSDVSGDSSEGYTFSNDPMADEEQFLELSLSIDDIIGMIAEVAVKAAAGAVTAGAGAFIELPPLNAEFDFTDFIHAEYSLLDLNVGVTAYAQQLFDYQPEFEGVIVLPDGTEIVFDLGSSVEIQLPDSLEGFELKPSIRLKQSTLTHDLMLRLQPFWEVSALGASAELVIPEAFGGGSLDYTLGPLVGTLEGSDIVPERHNFDFDVTIEVASRQFELQGFTGSALGTLLLVAPDVVPIAGGTFDSDEGWQAFGNVVVADGVATMTTASPVGLATTIDTPSDPFAIFFDYFFMNPSGGVLSVFLNGSWIGSLDAGDVPNSGKHSFYVDDPLLFDLVAALLLFEYFDVTGSRLQLDNIALSVGVATTEAQPIPEPSTLVLLGAVVVLLAWRLRRGPGQLEHRVEAGEKRRLIS